MNYRCLFKKIIFMTTILCTIMTLAACGGQSQSALKSSINYEDLEKTGQLELKYASQFSVDYYGDYKLITIKDSAKYFLIPENGEVPNNLPEDYVVLRQPLDSTYLVSTSVMDMLRQIDAISYVKFSGTKAGDWYIDEAREAMEDGSILYAGKYSAPDYEMILSEGCNFALENTMILHNPKVKEKLEELGIPVLVEKSSYEESPLGRLEWIKLYGLLFDKEEEANNYFDSQIDKIVNLAEGEDTGKSVAFFAVNSNGIITVRKPNDYLSKMIKMSGGIYALEGLIPEEENSLSTMNMQMEDFYLNAKDADILIYNSTIEGQLTSIDDLIEKNSLFKDFAAVKSKEVYCTSKNFFQESCGMAEFMVDLRQILEGEKVELTYLTKLN